MTAPMTDRTLPYPWGVCDACGEAAGLPEADRPGSYRCPACGARDALRRAAQDGLTTLAAPILGAWAAQWGAAGLSLEDLGDVTEHLIYAWAQESSARRYRRAALHRLARQYAPPAFELAPPDRAAVDLAALPLLTAYHPAGEGETHPHFADDTGEMHVLLAGLDTLTLSLPDGGRSLLFTGFRGQTDFERASLPGRAPGFRVPERLWPAVDAALNGRKADLPPFAVYVPTPGEGQEGGQA